MIKESKDGNPKKEEPTDLESQFILRLPETVATDLNECLKSGSLALKDRLSILLENDMRHGLVKFDNIVLHAKLVDIPTIIESYKTIDNRSLYKTADICQMLICSEEEELLIPEEENSLKVRKKDPNKVDKKYLWPHGIAPPLKNARKRRFRKTLKKKFIDAPEIEKEVKRLLRVDNEAVNVRWEVISEDDETKGKHALSTGIGNGSSCGVTVCGTFCNPQSSGIAEHDLFGEPVSDSDEEELVPSLLLDEDSQTHSFDLQMSLKQEDINDSLIQETADQQDVSESEKDNQFQVKILQNELMQLQTKRKVQEQQLIAIENAALQLRFKEEIQKLKNQEYEKERKISVYRKWHGQRSYKVYDCIH